MLDGVFDEWKRVISCLVQEVAVIVNDFPEHMAVIDWAV